MLPDADPTRLKRERNGFGGGGSKIANRVLRAVEVISSEFPKDAIGPADC